MLGLGAAALPAAAAPAPIEASLAIARSKIVASLARLEAQCKTPIVNAHLDALPQPDGTYWVIKDKPLHMVEQVLRKLDSEYDSGKGLPAPAKLDPDLFDEIESTKVAPPVNMRRDVSEEERRRKEEEERKEKERKEQERIAHETAINAKLMKVSA